MSCPRAPRSLIARLLFQPVPCELDVVGLTTLPTPIYPRARMTLACVHCGRREVWTNLHSLRLGGGVRLIDGRGWRSETTGARAGAVLGRRLDDFLDAALRLGEARGGE